ncbi:MAG: DMT family transporter [Candidatus Cloacimonetes bacterium]|nr:DMT family transporter [Candidatus Cloacimonadota bacterium]
MKNLGIYLQASFAMFLWAITFVWIKIALVSYKPIEIVFLRLLLATLILFGIIFFSRYKERLKARDFWHILLVAFCEPFCYFIGEANGMQYVSPTFGSLVISTIPLVSALGAWFFLREKITAFIVVGLIVSFSGVAILSFESPDLKATLTGVVYLMIAVLGGMFYGISVRNLTLKYSTLTIVAWQSFLGMLLFLPLFAFMHLKSFMVMQHSAKGLITISAMSICASVGAFMLYTGVIRKLGVIKSNVFTNLIPVFTVILAYLILGHKVTFITSIGLMLTIGGLLISQLKDLHRLATRNN